MFGSNAGDAVEHDRRHAEQNTRDQDDIKPFARWGIGFENHLEKNLTP